VAASGRRRSNEQFREGDAGAPRHSGGNVADEQAQDRRDGNGGHRLNQPWRTRCVAPRCRFNRSKPPTLSPARGTPRCPPILKSSKSVRRCPPARSRRVLVRSRATVEARPTPSGKPRHAHSPDRLPVNFSSSLRHFGEGYFRTLRSGAVRPRGWPSRRKIYLSRLPIRIPSTASASAPL
jgi:hypothetical protein